MRFEFYSETIADRPKLSVDGTVNNAIHFSHWQGNRTPASVKADTSTEIALNVIASPDREQLTEGIDLVTNNHFDTDGVLSVWTMLNGTAALELRDKLISAAEAGDFSELTSEDGVRASIVIQGSDSPADKSNSPLARQLTGEDVEDEAKLYSLVLPHVPSVITETSRYETLWRGPWNMIEIALNSFAKGTSRVEQHADGKLAAVLLAPEVFGARGFDPMRHAPPFTAISRQAHGELFLIAIPFDNGWAYRIDYPYYSWAETVVRPAIVRRDLASLISTLNELEASSSQKWRLDYSELASAAKFSDEHGKLGSSSLKPDMVVAKLRDVLREPRAIAAR